VLGDFDYTVINLKSRYVPRAVVVAVVGWVGLALVHGLVVRRRDRFISDTTIIVGILVALNLGLIVTYGWPLGFPLPPPAARYLPFFSALVLLVFAVLTALSSGIVQFLSRRS
jgi:cation transport ATPase